MVHGNNGVVGCPSEKIISPVSMASPIPAIEKRQVVHGRDHVEMQDNVVVPVCFAIDLQCDTNHMSAMMTRGRDSP